MEFRILGPLEVLENGRTVDLGGAKQRALLAILLLHANEVVSTDRLIDALWEDEPPETGRKALQVYVSQLRKALGKERLQTRAPGYLLRVEEEEFDLRRFPGLVASGRLGEALALWRGPALQEFTYQRFAQSEIGRLEELRLACLEDRIEADLAAGRHGALVGELEVLVSEHPLRERLRGQLMLALYRSGRQAEALDAYQDARRALVDELGIEPSPELRELEMAILRQDASLSLRPMTEVPTDATETTRGVFVGREAELAELRQAFADAVAGSGRLVLLVGEPGIGKSRLADEVMRHARTHGATVLVGRCWEGGGAPAYWPWVQSIREFVRNAEPDTLRTQLGPGAVDLAQIVPEVRKLLPDVPEPKALESESARFQLFDSTTTFLRTVAAERPLLLVLEDLHAADEPSLLLLRFVAGALGGSRILVVGTYRDVDPTVRDPLAATLAELAREPVTGRVQLTGLTELDVARFIELTADVDPSNELVTAIHDETEGNPLFVGEVVRLLSSEGRLQEADGRALSTLGIPQGIREVIGRRLLQLSDESTRVLTLAAVLGREFRLDVLERLSGLSANSLLDVLDEAITARLVMGVPGSRGQLRFAHALIRDTLYDELTTPRRVRLHRLVGEALETLYEEAEEPHLAEIAYHFFEAAPGGDVDRAVEYARRAADHAVRLLAYEETARLYASALEALELKPVIAARERCELLLGLGEAQARAGDESAARATFLRTAEVARSAGLSAELARAALGYSGRFVWMTRGLGEDASALLEDALSSLGERDSSLRARVLARLAGTLRDQPEPKRRDELSAEAVDMARRLDDRAALAYALDGRYSAIWGPHNVDERLPIIDEILTLADEVGDHERTIQARFYRAMAFFELCQMSDLYIELEEIERVVSDLRQPAQRWYVAVLRAILALFEGRFEVASRELIPNAFEIGRTMRAHMPRGSFRVQLFLLHREQGRIDSCVVTAEEMREWPTINAFECFIAAAYIEAGRQADARAILKRLAGIDFDILLDNDKMWGWSLLAEVSAALGEAAHASRLYELLSPYSERNAVCHPAAALGSVARYLGLAATTFERYDEAEQHFEAALAANERMGARPWLAHAQEDYGRMLFARDGLGDRERAGKLVDTALANYRELGMDGPLAKATAAPAR
jgi:DNA-binding SARP family transcriptional activator/tetratricopeptide (TPR) repeat protein